MKSSLRTRSTRGLAAGALSVALLTSAAATAFAADPVAPDPAASMSTKAPSPTATKSSKPTHKPAVTAASITIRANRTEVKSGQSVTFTGQTNGLKAGDRLDLQRFDGKKWVTVKTATVKKGSKATYTLVIKLTGMGKEMLRVVHGKTMSRTVTITVK
ncbi:hypothetical protein ACFYZJ_33615 [Streptomyces sp. NPDC001848]|uniref:hypothetical protein n=1 Tax=Streptomyces sp. NPDC001848 TaxID=3364618 RepID=UPI0036D003CF